jgi:tetratricopeptide (TPR) repeat protein
MVSRADRPDRQRGFQLLDPIRRFAAGRLENADDTLGRLHRYVLEVLRAANDRFGSQDLLMRRLDSEQLNLQVVIEWLGRSGQPSGPLLRALGDVWVWMLACGHLRQSSELWQRIQALPPSGLRTESDRLALQWLTANRLFNDGAFAEATALVDQMMPDARRVETPARIALLLTARAIVRTSVARDEARANFEEAVSVARAADDPLALGYALPHYGLLLAIAGDVTHAQERHQETLGIADSLNDQNLIAEAHYALALDVMLLGDPAPAQSHLDVAVDCYRDFDHLDGLTRCIGALSALALQRGHSELAARLVGASVAARDKIGLTPWPSVTELERRTNERIRDLAPDDRFNALVDSGRTLTINDALAEAHALLGPAPTSAD